MNYKKAIIKMIDTADETQLRKIYHFIKGFLGLG